MRTTTSKAFFKAGCGLALSLLLAAQTVQLEIKL